VVQKSLWVWPRIIRQSRLKPQLDIAPTDAPHLTGISADRLAGSPQGPALIKQLKNSNTAPITLAKSTEPFYLLEPRAIGVGKLQSPEGRSWLPHPQL
jgi:hypothetical protein